MSTPQPPDPDQPPPTPPPGADPSSGHGRGGTGAGASSSSGAGSGSSGGSSGGSGSSAGSGGSGSASSGGSGSASSGGSSTGGAGTGGATPEEPTGGRRGSRRSSTADTGGGAAASGSGDATTSTEGTAEEVAPPTPFTQQLGRVTIIVLAVLFGVFAVANSQPVDFSWVFGETTVRPDPDGAGTIGGVPLILLLLGAFVVGALVAFLTELYVSRARRARKAAQQGGDRKKRG